MSTANVPDASTEFVEFWNDVLVPKFVRFKHVLVDGLTHHSAAIFPKLDVRAGDHHGVSFTNPQQSAANRFPAVARPPE